MSAMTIVLAVALHESYLGVMGSFLMPDGSPSHNWGARKGRVTGPDAGGDDGCISHGDSDEAGKVCFSAFNSAIAGARGFFNTRAWGSSGFKEKTIAAAQAGDIYGVAKAMREGGYYAGFGCDVETYKQTHPWGVPLCAPGKPSSAGPPRCEEATPENVECAVRGYAKAIERGVKEVNAALGQPNDGTYLDLPAKSLFKSRTAKYVAAAGVVAGAYWLTMGGGYKYTRSILPLEGSL